MRRSRATSTAGGIVVAAVTATILAGASPAAAHSALERSSPRDGAIVGTAPTELILDFSEPPDLEISDFELLGADGSSRTLGPPGASGDGLRVTVPVPDLGEGSYTLAFRVTSTVDGHTTGGAITFGVGEPPPAPGAPAGSTYETPGPSPLSVAGRWLLDLGLAIIVAAAAMWWLVFRSERRPPGLRPVLVAAWAAAAVGAVAVTAAAADAADTSVGAFVSSPTGAAFVRQAVSVLVCGAAVATAVVRPTARMVALAGVAAAVAMLFHTIGGHAGAERDARWLAIGVQWIHVVAAGVWTGGLLWVLLGSRGLDRPRRADAIRGFSRLAGIALVLVLATGLLRSVDLLGGFGELGRILASDWGISLAVKLSIVVALVAAGAWNRFRGVPALTTGSDRAVVRTIVLEVVLAAGVFGATSILAGLPPPDDARAGATPPAPQVVVEGSDFATSVRVRLTVAPGRPGVNAFSASIVDFDSGAPVDAARVTVRASLADRPELDPVEIRLRRDGAVWTASSTALSIAGTWEGSMTIERADGSVEVPLDIAIEPAPQRVTVTPGTGDLPDLTTIELGDGRSVQAYLDPQGPGSSQLHLTAFDAAGQELPLGGATIAADTPDGEHLELDVTRLSPGHFASPVKLTPGPWTFSLEASARDGAPITTTFEQEVSG